MGQIPAELHNTVEARDVFNRDAPVGEVPDFLVDTAQPEPSIIPEEPKKMDVVESTHHKHKKEKKNKKEKKKKHKKEKKSKKAKKEKKKQQQPSADDLAISELSSGSSTPFNSPGNSPKRMKLDV